MVQSLLSDAHRTNCHSCLMWNSEVPEPVFCHQTRLTPYIGQNSSVQCSPTIVAISLTRRTLSVNSSAMSDAIKQNSSVRYTPSMRLRLGLAIVQVTLLSDALVV
jgi:hypothetical protein